MFYSYDDILKLEKFSKDKPVTERDILQRALERHRFNRTAAGASLGLSLRQMRYRMARLGINLSDPGGD